MIFKHNGRRIGLLLVFLALIAVLYLYNIGGWLMHDDEGTDLYEAWRLRQGDEPGVDFIAEQQPLFLLGGSLLIDLFGREILPLRLLSAVQVLIGAAILFYAVSRIWGDRAAVTALGVTLVSGLVFEQARLYRPDPMMLAWELAALGLSLLAVKKQKRGWWAAAGFCYGIAFLFKLFAVLPVFGLMLYYLNWWWRERPDWREIVRSGLAFSLPFLLTCLGLSVLLYSRWGFYYAEAFSHHAQLGQDNGLLQQLRKPLEGYGLLLLSNAIFVFIAPLWLLNRPRGWWSHPERRIIFWQLPVPLIFVFVTRPFIVRYLLFLIPVLAIILAWQIDFMLTRLQEQHPGLARAAPALMLVAIVFALSLTFPRVPLLLLREEGETRALANYIIAQTDPDDIVLADYAGLNFFAGRTSIYEASIIAGAQIDGQIVTGERLIRRIEEDEVQLVLIHIDGGEPPPHQLVDLVDYDLFSAYLDQHFDLLTLFDRAGQQIEVYGR
jgi:4-amino-4-deoxy-L-arabinose transferase-like glycosyltransferase